MLSLVKYFDIALVDEDAVAGLAGGLAQDAVIDECLDGPSRSREVGAQGSSNALDV